MQLPWQSRVQPTFGVVIVGRGVQASGGGSCRDSDGGGLWVVVSGQWPVGSGQWIVDSGQWIVARNYRGDVPAVERGIGWRCARTVVSAWLAMTRRLGMGRHGGMPLLALTRQLEPRTHGGIITATLTFDYPITRHVAVGEVSGGRCGGSPPAQVRAGTARPSERQLPVVGCRLSVASCRLLVASCRLPVVRNCGRRV